MPMPLGITWFNRRFLNPVMLKLVGLASLVDLEHVGRVSGRVLHTPLMAFRDGDEVTVALTYGSEVQWLKNVRAAGGARMRFGRDVVQLGPPRVLDAETGLARVSQPQRSLLRWPIQCHEFVALPVLPDDPR
ncbi:MAG: nitroreductase family deazaflavin-dependent oxidoreductase [Kineosporiaceae bacterium]